MSITERFWKKIWVGENYFYNEGFYTYEKSIPLAYPAIGLLAYAIRNEHQSFSTKILVGLFATFLLPTTLFTFPLFGAIALISLPVTALVDLISAYCSSPMVQELPDGGRIYTFSEFNESVFPDQQLTQQAILRTAMPPQPLVYSQPSVVYTQLPQAAVSQPPHYAQIARAGQPVVMLPAAPTLFLPTATNPVPAPIDVTTTYRAEPVYIATNPGSTS